MGIYITGLEMPTNCRDCPCFCEEYFYCRVKESDDIGLDKRPKDCPLIPVPPHGRLINADVLEELTLNDPSCITVFEAIKKLQGIPTIIPAEEGE